MTSKKISQLVDGSPVQPTDLLLIARSGGNFKLPASEFDSSGSATAAAAAAVDAHVAATDPHTQYAKESDLAAVASTGAYSDLSGKPTLGTAASENTTAFATAAQGTKSDAALPKAGGTMTGTLAMTAGGRINVTMQQGAASDYFMKLTGDQQTNPYMLGSFNLITSTAANANPGDPTRPHNTSFAFGYNFKPTGTGIEVAGEPAAGWILETSYFQGARQMEHHIQVYDAGGISHRPFTASYPHANANASTSALLLQVNLLNLNDWNGTNYVAHDWNNQRVTYSLSTKLRFDVNNVATWEQKTAAGDAYISGPYIASDNRLTVGESASIVGPTPTTGSYANQFLAVQATTLANNGILLNLTAPAVTGLHNVFTATGSATTGLVSYQWNQSANANAHSILEALTSGGDAIFSAKTGTNWAFGSDRSDSGKFKIDQADRSLGSNTAVTIDSSLNTTFGGTAKMKSYTVGTLPSASTVGAGAQAYATDASVGAVGVQSNGTNWKLLGTQTTVS